MSVYIPVRYCADKNTAFLAGDFQSRQRFNNSNDAQAVVGVGLCDAKKSVGVVLSYTLASVSRNFNSDFGIGGFNVKVHRQWEQYDFVKTSAIAKFILSKQQKNNIML